MRELPAVGRRPQQAQCAVQEAQHKHKVAIFGGAGGGQLHACRRRREPLTCLHLSRAADDSTSNQQAASAIWHWAQVNQRMHMDEAAVF